MNKPTLLTIVTDAGTFSRKTTRVYSHIVVASDNDYTGVSRNNLGVVGYAGSLALAFSRAHTARTLHFGYNKEPGALVYSDVRVYAIDGTRVQ